MFQNHLRRPYDRNVHTQTSHNRQRDGWSRPVALPDDFGRSDQAPEHGVVTLPVNVFWSGPDRKWDLANRRQRIQVYEMVLTEGTEDDVRRFIDIDELVRLWPDLSAATSRTCCLVRTPSETPRRRSGVLTDLQQRIALAVSEVVKGEGFALAGGAALISQGLVDRRTRDLDFFTVDATSVNRVAPEVESALQSKGMNVIRRVDAPGFVRLEVSEGSERSARLTLAAMHDFDQRSKLR